MRSTISRLEISKRRPTPPQIMPLQHIYANYVPTRDQFASLICVLRVCMSPAPPFFHCKCVNINAIRKRATGCGCIRSAPQCANDHLNKSSLFTLTSAKQPHNHTTTSRPAPPLYSVHALNRLTSSSSSLLSYLVTPRSHSRRII